MRSTWTIINSDIISPNLHVTSFTSCLAFCCLNSDIDSGDHMRPLAATPYCTVVHSVPVWMDDISLFSILRFANGTTQTQWTVPGSNQALDCSLACSAAQPWFTSFSGWLCHCVLVHIISSSCLALVLLLHNAERSFAMCTAKLCAPVLLRPPHSRICKLLKFHIKYAWRSADCGSGKAPLLLHRNRQVCSDRQRTMGNWLNKVTRWCSAGKGHNSVVCSMVILTHVLTKILLSGFTRTQITSKCDLDTGMHVLVAILFCIMYLCPSCKDCTMFVWC